MQQSRRGAALVVSLTAAIAAMTIIVRAAEPSGDAGEASGSANASMRQVVAALGYGPEVGDRFTSFGDGFPAERWRTSLAASPRRGDVSAVAEAETRVIDDLRRRLDAVIRQADGRSEYWNLPDVLADRRAQCLGNCQLWYVLGHSVGLDVGAVEVSWPPDGELGEHETHVATLVKLADGRVQMIDTRYGIKSEPFRFGEVYRRDGAVWTLANLTTRRLLHRRVRLLDRAGIEGMILLNIGNTYRQAGREAEAAPIYERGLELDPNSPALHLAVSETSFRHGLWDAAGDSIRTAIDLDPQYSDAHAALGRLLMRQNKWDEAIAALDRAIALKPQSPDTIRSRQEAERRRGEGAPAAGRAP
jgi:tetratricopeptide (TPR) repeat protein